MTKTAHETLIDLGAVASLGKTGDCWIPLERLNVQQREALLALESFGISPSELSWSRWCGKTVRTWTVNSASRAPGEMGISVSAFFVPAAAKAIESDEPVKIADAIPPAPGFKIPKDPDQQIVISGERVNRHGKAIEIGQLVSLWFPALDFAIIETGETEDGFLKFNLIVSYGRETSRVSYLRSENFKVFCEGELGRWLGMLDAVHEMRSRCEFSMRGESVPMFGWALTK